jgi:ATP-binding cassette subfamily C protein
LFDVPWIPLYLAICFAFHVWIGVTAMGGALVLIGLTLLTEALTRKPTKALAGAGTGRISLTEASRRNAEVLHAMGMLSRLSAMWHAANRQYMDAQQKTSDVAGGLGSASRVLRMLLQSCVLAVGAYLVINQEATAGVIIASSILVSRALAPVELSIANWKSFQAARQSWRRLSDLVALWPSQPNQLQLPSPSRDLVVESLTVTPPGMPKPVIHDVGFRLTAGQALGIIGPSAAGKSSLVRALVGAWLPARGKVRLDGAALDQWSADALGRFIGYLPQDVELFDGTVAQNIARFEPNLNSEKIVAAARDAGVHDLIVRLPDGYETKVGEGGTALSAGQRQRIALARALYGDPFLIVLDEPNSNLDAEGDEALARAVRDLRTRGAIVILVAHRPSALQHVDMILAIANGRQQAFGPKDDVLRKVLEPSRPVVRPMKVVGDSEGVPA